MEKRDNFRIVGMAIRLLAAVFQTQAARPLRIRELYAKGESE